MSITSLVVLLRQHLHHLWPTQRLQQVLYLIGSHGNTRQGSKFKTRAQQYSGQPTGSAHLHLCVGRTPDVDSWRTGSGERRCSGGKEGARALRDEQSRGNNRSPGACFRRTDGCDFGDNRSPYTERTDCEKEDGNQREDGDQPIRRPHEHRVPHSCVKLVRRAVEPATFGSGARKTGNFMERRATA